MRERGRDADSIVGVGEREEGMKGERVGGVVLEDGDR